MRVGICGLLAALALAGCARQSSVAEPPRPITCLAGADCDAKWSRAIAWVASNSRWKIQTQTERLVQTFSSAHKSASPGFTVTKSFAGLGLYDISFTGGCDSFGCVPTIAESREKFTDFVLAPLETPPPQPPPAPVVATKKR
jgi:hypothetical protein